MRVNHFDADWYKVRIVVERSIFSLALRVVLTRMTVRTELGVRGRQVVDDILSKGCCFYTHCSATAVLYCLRRWFTRCLAYRDTL